MSRKTILTCAVTGNLTTREQHPGLPVTPAEIAAAAVEAGKAGAAVVHLHARDPGTTKGTMDLALFTEIVDRIRQSGSDVILNLSTGEGGRFVPGIDDPKIAAPGTTLTTPERRVAHVEALKPEICTLDLNTMFSGSAVVINTPRNVTEMARPARAGAVRRRRPAARQGAASRWRPAQSAADPDRAWGTLWRDPQSANAGLFRFAIAVGLYLGGLRHRPA